MRYGLFSLSSYHAISDLFLAHALCRAAFKRGGNMSHVSLNEAQASQFKVRLRLAGYKINDFGHDGFCCEVDGSQVFRATAIGNGRYSVRFDERIFPDV